MSQSDNKIIKQIKGGDVAAYATLVSKYQNMAFTLALSITKNREDAEEVAQDAFVKAYKNLASFKGKSKFSTWLYQIVHNTALSKIRIKKHHTHPIDNLLEDRNIKLSESENRNLERLDKKRILKEAIKKLNEDEGFIIILYYYQELNIEEIAIATGYSESNVKVKLFRARKNLYEKLQIIMEGEARTLIQN
ncbi:RNA polymerase sigma factor [Plebeiibacterium marinum]|uniref:RNA polymerase sigma factor n=1 Tax=Plebeiibacterium marinum TaxID=2992111 RepID=A0AAE3MEA8_9BACT|nr:RNA polymerase sigma factor [Plebeiobacterium marinum]MCW3806022.1 RNA polymerase sigma factor [Plebeiobacterium marinum]